jgi:hypothetical protein
VRILPKFENCDRWLNFAQSCKILPQLLHPWALGSYWATSCLSKIGFSPQGRRERRESIFCLAGDTAKQKGFRPFNASLIIGAIATKRLRSSSRRVGVFDPIAVSRLGGRSRYGAAKARLDQKKNLPLRSPCLPPACRQAGQAGAALR